MDTFKITYILTTRNRLPFLQITLAKLIAGLLPEEEIVVVDGNSTDGAKVYLQQLFDEGKIHQYISEPDHNQAHGWNKALLIARGTVIKKIIDDDVHNYPAIRKCADYMLQNTKVDICISNCLTALLIAPQDITEANRINDFQKWKHGESASFTFSDVYMLIRRSALSYLGLFDTQFTMMDWEYSLRCSFLKANIAYYTGYNSLAVGTPGNVTSKTSTAKLKAEGLIGKLKYNYSGDRSGISFYSEFKIAIGKIVYRNRDKNVLGPPNILMPQQAELVVIYDNFYARLEEQNRATDTVFIN